MSTSTNERRVTASAAPQPAPGTYRIGVGAGFAGDRYEPAIDLARFGQLDALAFECLAERTIGLAQRDKNDGSSAGFDSRILRRMGDVLPLLPSQTIVTTNAGAANPLAAAKAVAELIDREDLPKRAIGVVTGDDILHSIDLRESRITGTDDSLWDVRDRLVSANVYLGAEGLLQSLERDASIVITGRSSDAALFIAPLAHHFGWSLDDLDAMANATLVGHLLECGGQLTGGYFADGERKQVDGLWNLGFPYADVDATGSAHYAKLPGSGGLLSRETVLEQLLYEIDDPYAYKTPDVTVDLSNVRVGSPTATGLLVDGATAAGRPDQLKVSVGLRDGFLAIAEISYTGTSCLKRAALAAEIIGDRWEYVHGRQRADLKITVVGVNSTRAWWEPTGDEPAEVRLRCAVRSDDRTVATRLCDEVEALYTNGPAGGGGVTASIRETVGIVSTFVPRESVQSHVEVIR